MTDQPAPQPAVLIGTRIRLRPITSDDHARLEAILAEPSVARWWGPAEPTEAARDWLDADPGTAVFAIEHDGQVVGSIQWSEEPDPDYRSAAIDLFLATEWQGRGLGPDALRTIARHLFEQRGHHRLTIDPAATNERAIRAYRSVGFRPIGVLRAYERGRDGTFHDGLLMDLLAGELRGRLPQSAAAADRVPVIAPGSGRPDHVERLPRGDSSET